MEHAFFFFWLSINYASNFPIILPLSYAANPCAIVVKCSGSVYDVDVENYDKSKAYRHLYKNTNFLDWDF